MARAHGWPRLVDSPCAAMQGGFLDVTKVRQRCSSELLRSAGRSRGLFQSNTRAQARGSKSQAAIPPAGMLSHMALSPFRDRLMLGYAATRTLDRQADALRARMADLASDPSAVPDVLATIQAIRDTLNRAEQTARRLAAEQGVMLPNPSNLKT